MKDIMRDGFMGIMKYYKEEFEKRGQHGFDFIRDHLICFSVPLEIMTEVYMILIKEGKCMPLEMLPTEEKTALWFEAKRMSKNREQKHLINVCRALHAFGTYISLED